MFSLFRKSLNSGRGIIMVKYRFLSEQRTIAKQQQQQITVVQVKVEMVVETVVVLLYTCNRCICARHHTGTTAPLL